MLEQHAFTRTTLANNGRHLTIVDFQIDPIEDCPVPKAPGDISKFD
jgi:hypothetical protein